MEVIRGYLMFCLYKHKFTPKVLGHYNVNVTKALNKPHSYLKLPAGVGHPGIKLSKFTIIFFKPFNIFILFGG